MAIHLNESCEVGNEQPFSFNFSSKNYQATKKYHQNSVDVLSTTDMDGLSINSKALEGELSLAFSFY